MEKKTIEQPAHQNQHLSHSDRSKNRKRTKNLPRNKNSSSESPSSKHRNFSERSPSQNSSSSSQKERTPFSAPIVFAQCQICSAGISNENYALKTGENSYTHFECIMKKLREIAQKNYVSYGKRLRYTYMGSNTFAIYIEQGGHAYSWKILEKIKLEKILPKTQEKISEEN